MSERCDICDSRDETLAALTRHAREIVDREDLSWEQKFDRVFSHHLSDHIFKLSGGFDYYDPDTTYEEDVLAFVKACEKRFL